jgi:hypothetical protein
MIMLISRQYLVDTLHRLSYEQAAEVAERELPDPADSEEVAKLGERLGIYFDDIISGMGGSP